MKYLYMNNYDLIVWNRYLKKLLITHWTNGVKVLDAQIKICDYKERK